MDIPIQQHLLILLTACMTMTAQLLMRLGVKGTAVSILSIGQFLELVQRVISSPLLLAGYGLSAVTGLVWLAVLSRTDLSYAVPLLTAMSFVVLVILSTVVLHESVTPWRWAGMVLIIAGVALISKGG
jgi:drug/metabolite transporter (DMT)-like permease